MVIIYKEKKYFIELENINGEMIVFVCQRDENIETKVLEQLLTMFLIKLQLHNEANKMRFFTYNNEYLLSRIIDSTKLFELDVSFYRKVKINQIKQVDEGIRIFFKQNVTLTAFHTICFDEIDFSIFTKQLKREKRIADLYKQKRTLPNIFGFFKG